MGSFGKGPLQKSFANFCAFTQNFRTLSCRNETKFSVKFPQNFCKLSAKTPFANDPKSELLRKVYFRFARGPVQFSWPRGVAENWFTSKPGFWEHFGNLSYGKNSQTESSLNFLQSGPQKFTKSDFSGLAAIQRVFWLLRGETAYWGY